MRHGAANRLNAEWSQPAGPADWEDDAETEYQPRPGTYFNASPTLRLGHEDPSARFEHPASGEWVRTPVQMPASEFGRAFGYEHRRRSRGWLWLVLIGAGVFVAAAYAREPHAQAVLDRLSSFADQLGIREPLDRVMRRILTRASVTDRSAITPAAKSEPAAVHSAPSASSDASPAHRPALDAKPAPRATRVPWSETPAGLAWRARHALHVSQTARTVRAVDAAPLTPSALESAPDDPPSPASGDATGVLAINSLPWAEISIDGNWMGTTPQREIKLREGRHKIKLVNPDMHLVRIFTLNIEAGQTLTKSVLLSP